MTSSRRTAFDAQIGSGPMLCAIVVGHSPIVRGRNPRRPAKPSPVAALLQPGHTASQPEVAALLKPAALTGNPGNDSPGGADVPASPEVQSPGSSSAEAALITGCGS
jgi:hypothetical protein